ncbi:hypothetical protein ACJX0J_029666, partial [Zea mays]
NGDVPNTEYLLFPSGPLIKFFILHAYFIDNPGVFSLVTIIWKKICLEALKIAAALFRCSTQIHHRLVHIVSVYSWLPSIFAQVHIVSVYSWLLVQIFAHLALLMMDIAPCFLKVLDPVCANTSDLLRFTAELKHHVLYQFWDQYQQ